jgi:hypothetical protein
MAQPPQGEWVNFAQLKENISFSQLLSHFDLAKGLSQKGEDLEGSCPICKCHSGERDTVGEFRNRVSQSL